MHTTALRKVGGSVMLAVPPRILDELHLSAGEKVGLRVEEGRLVIEPQPRPRYGLDELLRQCDPAAADEADGDWTAGEAVGRELI